MIKPEPAVFLHLLDKFALRAEESVFIDDAAANVDAAKSVGLHAIWFRDAAQCRRISSGCGRMKPRRSARHFPLNCGARLVRNASTPSAKSSVSASCACSVASNASCCCRVPAGSRLNASLMRL